jgi:type III pantothenate kinase
MAGTMNALRFAADIGNSCIKIAGFSGNRPLFLERFFYNGNFARAGEKAGRLLSVKKARSVSVGSVNSKAGRAFLAHVKKYDIPCAMASKKNLGGVKSLYSIKAIGMDRLANIVGARALYKQKNIITLDFGTALTVDVIEGAVHTGGFIVPGPQTLLDSLFDKTDNLPRIIFSDVKPVLGRNTRQAIANGCLLLMRGGVRELVNSIISGKKKKFTVITTGGGAKAIKNTGIKTIVDPYLTARGIRILAKKEKILKSSF